MTNKNVNNIIGNLKMSIIKRENGKVQPHISLFGGFFKVRFPFLHYNWSWPDAIQGTVLAATGLAAIPVIQMMGVPVNIAVLMVFISSCLYLLHTLLGDPVVPGWITPGLPLVLAFMTNVPMAERIYMIMAAQITIGVVFLVFGTTGIAAKFVNWLPNAIKGGVILGAGVAAVMGEFKIGGRFMQFPFAASASILVAFFLLYSTKGKFLRDESPLFAKIVSFGIVPGVVVAGIIGTIFGEITWQPIEWGFSFSLNDFHTLISDWSVFGLGIPKLSYFINTIGLVVALYVIAYGDLITGQSVLKEADEVRNDELIEVSPNRINFLCGIRNLVLGCLSPYPVFHGPVWGGAHIATVERYKLGRKSMDSIYDGSASFYLGATIALCLAPFVCVLKPLLPVALTLTMIMQGWVCTYIAVNVAKSNKDIGVMGVIAGVIAVRGATWGLAVGVILYIFLYKGTKKKTLTESE